MWRASIMAGRGEEAEATAQAEEEGIERSGVLLTSRGHSHQLETDVGKVQCLGDIRQINGGVHGSKGGKLKKEKVADGACEVGVDLSEGGALVLRVCLCDTEGIYREHATYLHLSQWIRFAIHRMHVSRSPTIVPEPRHGVGCVSIGYSVLGLYRAQQRE